jgi:Ca2+-transporting ATPase
MAAMAPPWTRSAQGALDDLQTSLQGLSAEEVELRRQQHGFNELQKEPGKPMWRLILEQFDDMLVKVGCVAVWSEW